MAIEKMMMAVFMLQESQSEEEKQAENMRENEIALLIE